jgi:streptogramin lyase
VSRIRQLSLVVAVATVAPLARAAQPLALKHQLSLYRDEKDVGFRAPEGVACADGGTIVVSDTRNARLVRFTLKDKDLTGGTSIRLADGARPGRSQIDREGRVLVLDGRTRSILRVDVKGVASRVAFNGDSAGDKTVPVAFKLDGGGNLYVLDVAARRVLVLDGGDTVVRKIELPTIHAAAFTDLAVDQAGTIYVLETVGATIWVAQKTDASFKQVSQSLKEYMSFPTSLTVYKGSLLVTDQNGAGIVSLGLDGSYRGRQLAMGATEGLLYYPSQLCVTSDGELFIADRGNNRVQLFTVLR